MSIQFSGLGSGLPTADWIEQLVAVKQKQLEPLDTKLASLKGSNNAINTIKTSFENFKNSLTAFTSIINGTTNDLFAHKSSTSSLKDSLTATVNYTTPFVKYIVSLVQLATSTVTKSSANAGELINDSTKFSDITNAQTGTVSFVLNGEAKTIEIEKEDTMQDVLDKINGLFTTTGSEVTATLDADGNFTLTTDGANTLTVGLATDTSNFKNILKLGESAVSGSDKVISNHGIISTVKTNVALTSADANFSGTINAGKFKINNEEFEITSTTTMNELVSKINSNKNAGVQASFDSNTNKFTLTSTTTGGVGINMQDDGTNFFNAMQLSNDSSSTTLGKDAIVEINGTRVISSSNTITNTGYDGLVINALKMPKDNEVTTISVTNDPSEIKKAVQSFVDTYNVIMKQVQEVTKKEGYLPHDQGLRGIYNELRSIASSLVSSDGEFSMLAQLGVTTGAVGSSVDAEIITLKIDSTKLDEAIARNPEGVKNLFTNSNGNGIADKLLKKTEDSLALEYGYFAARSNTISKQITIQDKRVTKMLNDIELYRTSLTKQFASMDQLISKLNNQYKSFTSSGIGG